MNFDEACRLIASPASRRDVFKAILASFAAAAVPSLAQAAKPVVVKTVNVRVTNRDERQCNFVLFNRVKAVNCPKNTTKQIDSHTGPKPNPNPLCQRRVQGRKVDWIGEVTVRCIKGVTSPS